VRTGLRLRGSAPSQRQSSQGKPTGRDATYESQCNSPKAKCRQGEDDHEAEGQIAGKASDQADEQLHAGRRAAVYDHCDCHESIQFTVVENSAVIELAAVNRRGVNRLVSGFLDSVRAVLDSPRTGQRVVQDGAA
jgi:hypothetical protein